MSGIKDWIREKRSKGYTYTQIEQHLVNNGYRKAEIDSLILEVEMGHDTDPSKKGPSALIWIIFILLIIGGAAAYFVFFHPGDYWSEKRLPINDADSISDMNVPNSGNLSRNISAANPNASIMENISNGSRPINISNVSSNKSSNISSNISSNVTANSAGNAPNVTLICGDNKVNGTEECDGTNLKGLSCRNFTNALGGKFNGGYLRCDQSCRFNLSKCTYCGDGMVDTDSGEYCENGVGFVVFTKNGNRYDWLVSQDDPCRNFGYRSGTARCNFDTCQWDISGCTNRVSAVCGNGKLETSEECDYGIIGRDNESSCTQFNYSRRISYTGGELECTQDCRHDFSGCTYTDD